ncbi:MAG: hypothetical protein AABY64_12025 [Bdellovibrionota bacterium]
MKWQSSFKTKNLLLRLGVSLIAMSLLGVESYQSAVAFRSGKEAILKAASNSLMDKIDRNLFERYGDVQAFALDGIQMLTKIKASLGGVPFPVFMLTTETSANLKSAGKEVGVMAWINKPFAADKLLGAITKVLEMKKAA